MASKESNQPGVDRQWDLTNLPPEGHADVPKFFYGLYEAAKSEKARLQIPERAQGNYRLFRGDHWQKQRTRKDFAKMTINLYFANVMRTKSVLTSRNPVAEVVDMDGVSDDASKVLTAKLKKWWKDTNQKKKLSTTALSMESYGITIERPYWDFEMSRPDVKVWDIYGFFPAPGNYSDIARYAPYICYAEAVPTEKIEKEFKQEKDSVLASDVYSLLGEDREEYRPIPVGSHRGVRGQDHVNYSSGFQQVGIPRTGGTRDIRQARGLKIEIWVRDYSTHMVKGIQEFEDPLSGGINYVEIKEEQPKYPGGIRRVTITNDGDLLLEDIANPNINPELPIEKAKETFLYNNFPCIKANSYEDTTSIWGFSAAEQVADLNMRIDEIVTKLARYAQRAMFPTLIIPKASGITRKMLNTKPNLVLMVNNNAAAGLIKYLPQPALSASFFKVLEVFISFFDRIYQIEDADRGVVPNRVVAASAIVALQERNMVLMHDKSNSIEYVVENRGKCAISLYQNFGWQAEMVDVDDEPVQFIGTDYSGRSFNYAVEAGSTMPKTSLQVQEQAEKYYDKGIIDRQAVLENSGFPNWKKIIERVGEGQLNQALQILIQAGMDEEMASQLREQLMQSQGGPGNVGGGQRSGAGANKQTSSPGGGAMTTGAG